MPTDSFVPIRRLLVTIASYGTASDKYLHRLISEYRSMRFHTHIVVLSNVEKSLPDGVEVRTGLPTKNPWSLPWAHKKVLAERVNDYDLFIYTEDDILITQRNIDAFLEVSKELQETEIPGFLRYENGPNATRSYINLHGHYHWEPSSVCERGAYTFAFLTNEHSGCYLVTRKQLQHAIHTGRYLLPPHQGKYDLACTAATDPYTVCGFRKLICISHLEDFLVHHLPDKYTGPEFDPSEQAFVQQLQALMNIRGDKTKQFSLVKSETNLPAAKYSKQRDEEARDDLLNLLPKSVRKILSVGSGWGRTERWLARKGFNVTAIPLDGVVGACLEGRGIKLAYGDLHTARETLDGEIFDCVLLSNILHLFPNPETSLCMFADLLDQGGCVLVVTPNVATIQNQLYRLLGKPGYRKLNRFEQSGVQFVSVGRVREWFNKSGFVVEKLSWVATPRFEKIVSQNRRMIGPLFASEMIVLGSRSEFAKSAGTVRTRQFQSLEPNKKQTAMSQQGA